jgi:hypothetical protein
VSVLHRRRSLNEEITAQKFSMVDIDKLSCKHWTLIEVVKNVQALQSVGSWQLAIVTQFGLTIE